MWVEMWITLNFVHRGLPRVSRAECDECCKRTFMFVNRRSCAHLNQRLAMDAVLTMGTGEIRRTTRLEMIVVDQGVSKVTEMTGCQGGGVPKVASRRRRRLEVGFRAGSRCAYLPCSATVLFCRRWGRFEVGSGVVYPPSSANPGVAVVNPRNGGRIPGCRL